MGVLSQFYNQLLISVWPNYMCVMLYGRVHYFFLGYSSLSQDLQSMCCLAYGRL